MTASSPRTIQSSEKLLQIVDVLVEEGQSGITKIARDTGIHKSTVYTHVHTLRENGIVVRRDGEYRLSLSILEMSETIRNHRPMYRFGNEEANSLAKTTGELVCLTVPENEMTVVVHVSQGEKVSQTLTIGTRIPMLDSPIGKVILAYRKTETTTTDDLSLDPDLTARPIEQLETDALRSELEDIRNDGYCISDERNVDGTPYVAEPEDDTLRAESHRVDVDNRAIAAPVIFHDEPIGAVGIIGPSKRLSGEYCDDLRRQVVQTAALIGKKIHIDRS